MKTNRLLGLVVGCLMCATGVLTMSCTDTTTPGKDNQLPDTRDTTTLVDTVALPFGVERITIGAAGGEQEVGFKPIGDWSFTSSTDWLKVTSASGKVADNVLKFTVEPFNELGGKREAITTIKIGDVSMVVKFTQNGTPRFVHVYDLVTTFNDQKTKATVSNIISNVELEVASFPDWVKSVEIMKDPVVDTQYIINMEAMGMSFDNMLRTAAIVVRDKNFPEYTADIVVNFEESVMPYIATAGFASDFIFRGAGTTADLTSSFTVSSKPGQEACELKFYVKEDNGTFRNEATWVKYTAAGAAVMPFDAYTNKNYSFTLDGYADPSGPATRTAYLMAIPLSEMNGSGTGPIEMKDSYQVMTISQEKYVALSMVFPVGGGKDGNMFVGFDVKCVKAMVGPNQYKIGMSDLTTITMVIKMAKGIEPKFVFDTIPAREATGPNNPAEPRFIWQGSISKTFVSEGNNDIYTVKMICDAHDYKVNKLTSLTFNLRVYHGTEIANAISMPLSYVHTLPVPPKPIEPPKI